MMESKLSARNAVTCIYVVVFVPTLLPNQTQLTSELETKIYNAYTHTWNFFVQKPSILIKLVKNKPIFEEVRS